MCRLKAEVTDSGKANLASVPPKMQVAGSWQANKNVQVKVSFKYPLLVKRKLQFILVHLIYKSREQIQAVCCVDML